MHWHGQDWNGGAVIIEYGNGALGISDFKGDGLLYIEVMEDQFSDGVVMLTKEEVHQLILALEERLNGAEK